MRTWGIILIICGFLVGSCSTGATAIIDQGGAALADLEQVELEGDAADEQVGWLDMRVAEPSEDIDPAPMTGREAEWWSLTTAEHWEVWDRCASRDSDGDCRSGTESHTRTIGVETSGDLHLESGGELVVVESERAVRAGTFSDTKEDERDAVASDSAHDDATIVRTEDALEAGTKMSVSGRFRRSGDGWRATGVKDVRLVSEKSMEQRLDEFALVHRIGVGVAAAGGIALLLGVVLLVKGVRSASARQRAARELVATMAPSTLAPSGMWAPAPLPAPVVDRDPISSMPPPAGQPRDQGVDDDVAEPPTGHDGPFS